MVSKEDYYQGLMYSTDKNSYHCASTQLKTIEIDTTDIVKQSYVTSVMKVQHILILNKCVLFDPSSNRVVNVDYYPIIIERKILSSK